MPTLALRIRDRGGLASWFGRTFGGALGGQYAISMRLDDEPQRIGPARREQIDTGWGGQRSGQDVARLLQAYRPVPSPQLPMVEIRTALHGFLFAGGSLDAPFVHLSKSTDVEVVVESDDAGELLVVSLPWELADGAPQPFTGPIEPPLEGTLAGLPVARRILGARSQLRPNEERLRVAYCVSESPRSWPPIDARGFQGVMEEALNDRSGMLDHQGFTGSDFQVRFDDLAAHLASFRPHVLAVVCHGRTEKGQPQVLFETWRPAAELAEVVRRTERTFLVLLVACDQVYLDSGPSAHSGAVTFLRAGVPAVVAMQSSVRADLARVFVGAVLDRLLTGSSTAAAVAEGRRRMAPTAEAVAAYPDWSFPSLFITMDGSALTRRLAQALQFRSGFEALLRSIPRPEPYLRRPALDDSVLGLMKAGVAGLCNVNGGAGTGKSTVVRWAARAQLEAAIRGTDTRARPLLYVDLERTPRAPQTGEELLDLLRQRARAVSPVEGAMLFAWPPTRGADGALVSSDTVALALACLDESGGALALDHVPDAASPPWAAFLDGARNLNRAVVLVVTENPVAGLPAEKLATVLPLTKPETAEYCRQFLGALGDAEDAYAATGGVLALLNALRSGSGRGGGPAGIDLSATLLKNLSPADRMVLCALTHVPTGVDNALGWRFVPGWPDANIDGLVKRGALLREYPAEERNEWVRLPGLFLQALQRFSSQEVDDAGRSLAEGFRRWVGADPETRLAEVAGLVGGVEFVLAIQTVLIRVGRLSSAAAIPVLLHETLFQRGLYRDAREFSRLILEAEAPERTTAQQWLLLARANHQLGLSAQAAEALRNAEHREPDAIERSDILIQRALLIKDSGATGRAAEVDSLFEEALALLDQASTDDEYGPEDLALRRAMAVYNRALHRRYWLRDVDGALEDLETARGQFERAGNRVMQALCSCEWAEVQFVAGTEPNWLALLERLVDADALLAEAGNEADRAFCSYQLARCYRRQPYRDATERAANLTKAREAYRLSADQAGRAGDQRQQLIAEGHQIELMATELAELQPGEAATRLRPIVSALKKFVGDAWATRVLRDLLLCQAQLTRATDAAAARAALQDAWRVATSPPLDATRSTDARRARQVLVSLVTLLQEEGARLDVDKFAFSAQPLIERWVGRTVDPTRPADWLADVGRVE